MANDSFVRERANSYLSGGNISYIEQLYDAFLKDPSSVAEPWRQYFTKLKRESVNGFDDIPLSDIREHFLKSAKTGRGDINYSANISKQIDQLEKQVRLDRYINAYRSHGHQHAKLDPLELRERREMSDLELGHYGFTQADLDSTFDTNSLLGMKNKTLRSIQDALIRTYADTVGIEYMHITDVEQTQWLQQRLESVLSHPTFPAEEKKRILNVLTEAEGIERYLGTKFVGQTRFSLEGAVTLMPILDELVQRAGTQGVKELIIGMGHRGRLNTLVNIMGRPIELLMQDFEGKLIKPGYSGDVKYHLGYSSNVKTPGGVIHLALTFNPSHLEIIDPVVEGSVRARQDRRADTDRDQVVPVLVHGDAAFAGQGVVMETFSFSQARGFSTGGTIHIVVNNQIGFTTSNPLDARSSLYCTDIAKMVQAPVFHVNADDPEACVFITQVALDFRMRFKKDVVIDLVCYRRLGHNEADEPSATQPLMYRKIRQHPRTHEIYSKQLIAENVVTAEEVTQLTKQYKDKLDNFKTIVETVPKSQLSEIYANWIPYKDKEWTTPVNTAIPLSLLQAIGQHITTVPETFALQAQVAKEYENRRLMIKGELPINWGMGESLAFASLLQDGFPVRISGQDSGRGTFAHRHAVLHDQNDGKVYIPLDHVSEGQANFWIIDSILSEEAVLGFEYGYATTDPETLVIWEAQYGDFVNGAQVVIDQFITSGEQKWSRLCGLVMFLPHGYEGAGPEHSSARPERFLQNAAQDNIQVCIPTTPAQIFHLLRRQILRPYRKPLIVLTPKSVLRNRLAVSTLQDFTEGEFQTLIPEIDAIKPNKARRVILCTGKVYYDLLAARREKKQDDVAILRIEQLYPFPKDALRKELERYKNVKEVWWCQEEPENQGAWDSIERSLLDCLVSDQKLGYVGRPASAAPSTGYTSIHLQEQAQLVKDALE